MTFPTHLQFLLTERCNLSCRHCAVPTELSPATTELSTDDWYTVIERLGPDVESLTLAGGEALLRRDVIDIALAAVGHGIPRVTIVSNGAVPATALLPGLVAAQRAHDALRLHVSIDGARARSHDWMRGFGSFDKVVRFARRTIDLGGRIDGVQTVLHRGNAHEVEAMSDLAQSFGARFLVLFPLGPVGRGVDEQEHRMDVSSWEQVFAAAERIRATTDLEVHLHGPILGAEWPVVTGETIPRRAAPHGEMVVVGPDGEMFTCPPLRHVSLGNAATDADLRAGLDSGRRLMESACSRCEFQLMCCGVDAAQPFVVADALVAGGNPADVVV